MEAKEVNRRIEKAGGIMIRQIGSHRRYKLTKNNLTCYATVPQHAGKDIPVGTLKNIEKQLDPILGKRWLIK